MIDKMNRFKKYYPVVFIIIYPFAVLYFPVFLALMISEVLLMYHIVIGKWLFGGVALVLFGLFSIILSILLTRSFKNFGSQDEK